MTKSVSYTQKFSSPKQTRGRAPVQVAALLVRLLQDPQKEAVAAVDARNTATDSLVNVRKASGKVAPILSHSEIKH